MAVTPEPLRAAIPWGVVGCGAVAGAHADSIRRTDAADLVGFVDIDPGRRLQFASTYATAAWPDIAAMVAGSHPVAATVAVPNHLHVDVCEQLASNGVAALVEKPLAVTPDECGHLETVFAERAVPIGAILNMRYLPANRAISELCRSGALQPSCITITGDLVRRHRGSWRTAAGTPGSGLLYEVGVHFLDLLLWWLGDPTSVASSLHGVPTDGIRASFGWDGPTAELDLSATRTMGRPVTIHIDSPQGHITVTGGELVDASSPLRDLLEARIELLGGAAAAGIDLPFGPGHLLAIADAARSLRDTGSFPIGVREAARAVALCHAIEDQAARVSGRAAQTARPLTEPSSSPSSQVHP